MKDLLNEDHYSYKIHILPIKSIAKLPSIDTLYGLLLSVSQGNLNLGPTPTPTPTPPTYKVNGSLLALTYVALTRQILC